MLTAVTGINWGDEGKGRVIDLLAEHADVVARYQGGNNAGHTVVTEQGKFILNLLPSGILHQHAHNAQRFGEHPVRKIISCQPAPGRSYQRGEQQCRQMKTLLASLHN